MSGFPEALQYWGVPAFPNGGALSCQSKLLFRMLLNEAVRMIIELTLALG